MAQKPFHSPTKNVKLSVQVLILDSEYVMIPKLEVIKKGFVIQVRKPRWYSNEANPVADGRFELREHRGNYAVNLYSVFFDEPMRGWSLKNLMNFTYNSSLADTVNLKNLAPLEVGEYDLFLYFKYYYKGAEYVIQSDRFKFKVLFKPRNSIYDGFGKSIN